jgi:hypothetical protein
MKLSKKWFIGSIALLLLPLFLLALKPQGMTHLQSLWVGDMSQTASVTPSDNDVFIYGTLEVDGNVRFDGTLTATIEREIALPLGSFGIKDTGVPLTASTTPGFEEDDAMPNIVWADGETSPVIQSFRVPTDYSSGGAFRVLATESDSTTPNEIDFDVYVNADGTAVDASATGQTPVALAGTTSTPDVVTLTPATDFASLAAGQWVTLRIWRDNTAAGTGDLEVKGVSFHYTASQ